MYDVIIGNNYNLTLLAIASKYDRQNAFDNPSCIVKARRALMPKKLNLRYPNGI